MMSDSPQVAHGVLVLILELVEASSLGGGPADAGAEGLGKTNGNEKWLPESDLGSNIAKFNT
jgi:hypothetical protein